MNFHIHCGGGGGEKKDRKKEKKIEKIVSIRFVSAVQGSFCSLLYSSGKAALGTLEPVCAPLVHKFVSDVNKLEEDLVEEGHSPLAHDLEA